MQAETQCAVFLRVKKAFFFLVVRSDLHTANYAGRFPNKRSLLATSTPLGVEGRRRCISAEFKQIKIQGEERKLNSFSRKNVLTRRQRLKTDLKFGE